MKSAHVLSAGVTLVCLPDSVRWTTAYFSAGNINGDGIDDVLVVLEGGWYADIDCAAHGL